MLLFKYHEVQLNNECSSTEETAMICRKCYVSGIVQGVFYRDTVKKQVYFNAINQL